MREKQKILLVEDDQGVRKVLEAILIKKGFDVLGLENAEQALELVNLKNYQLVITDLRLPGLSGEDLLDKIKIKAPQIPVIVISGFGNTKNIVEVIKKGAEDYLSKPFTTEDLEIVIYKALEKRKLLIENDNLRKELSGNLSSMIGKSSEMIKVFELIQKFATSESHVLITGESGVGKELAARAIHSISKRSNKPLVVVNAGSIPTTLFESEMFGVKKGAFTGSNENREGLFQVAEGGTLFLDEIAEIPLDSQAKLLRVLDSGEIKSVGDTRTRKINVRIIAATNQNLEEMIENKTFRKDLFFRLFGLGLNIPPLRERLEDIPLLAQSFLDKLNENKKKPIRISPEAYKWLLGQKWKGNVRELKNALERGYLLSNGTEILKEDLAIPDKKSTESGGGLFRQFKKLQMNNLEKDYLVNMLKKFNGNVTKAANEAGLARRNFQTLIKKHGIVTSRFRPNSASDH